MKKLLLTGAFDYNLKHIKELENLGYDITFIQDERKKLEFDPFDIDAVVCNGLFLYNDIKDFKSLKTIQLTSAGFDRVPIDYINKKNIEIFNAKDVYSIPMAEWAVLKILEIYKKSKQFYKNQENHKWEKQRDILELTDKTVSIIGYGHVGTEIGKRLKPFGVNIIGVGRKKTKSNYLNQSLSINQIDQAIKKSDIIILTLPLTEETKEIIDKEKINLMKDQAVLVNLARGGLIDESGLIEALNKEKFLGVALDVFNEEPLAKSQLWEFENVIITPHNSFVSDKIDQRLFDLMVVNLKSFIENNPLEN